MKSEVRESTPAVLSQRFALCGWILLVVMALASTGSPAEQVTASVASDPGRAVSQPRISPSTFTRDMSFGQAIQILRQSTKRPLNIVVYWKEIADNAGVFQDTPIGVDGVTGLTVRQHLEILLGSISATSGARLGFVVNRGVIVIATVNRLPKPKRITRVYDVSDLVAPPSMAFGPGMRGGFRPGMGMRGPMGMGGFGQYGGFGGQPGMVRPFPGRTGRR